MPRISKHLATFFLLPNKASATFSITYVQDGEPKLEFKKSNIALPTSSAWIQGAGVNYQLDVKKDGSVIATVGQDWTSGSGGGMSGKEKGIASATDSGNLCQAMECERTSYFV